MLVNSTNMVEKRIFIELQGAGLVFSGACQLAQCGRSSCQVLASAQLRRRGALSVVLEAAAQLHSLDRGSTVLLDNGQSAHPRPRRNLIGEHT
ncbi:hypothetical protein DEV91_1487 [Phyllobacterium brassicacearum]|nr:hypothetical protein DEV91_1487 [Phyllobacterium brassicacearum]